MSWKIITTDEEGMTVSGPRGEITVFWEQKPALLEAGILAVFLGLTFDGKVRDFDLKVLAGEVVGVDRDTEIHGAVRDPDLMKLFLKERGKLLTM